MKISIDLDNTWTDGEGNISAEIKSALIAEAIATIRNSIRVDAKAQISEAIKAQVDKQVKATIEEVVAEVMASGDIFVHGKTVKITDHIKEVFLSRLTWANPQTQIAKIAQAFGVELKARYDAAYANQIIVALNAQGLINSDVAKLLLSKVSS